MDRRTVAAIQMSSGEDLEANLAAAERGVRRAAEKGATLALLPENFAFMGDGSSQADTRRLALAESVASGGPILERMGRLANATRMHLILGAMPEKASEDPGRTYNTSVVLGPEGTILSTYRKIHLFDVAFENGPTHRESRTVVPGETSVVARLPGLPLGLTICYDLRFPELFRRLALDGAELFSVPAAFTLHTGKDHWEVLLRARAIENTCYVLAAAQWGSHPGGRTTWGKSMIVDPWGQVLAACSEGEGIAVAEIDPDLLSRVRAGLSTLRHVRPIPNPSGSPRG